MKQIPDDIYQRVKQLGINVKEQLKSQGIVVPSKNEDGTTRIGHYTIKKFKNGFYYTGDLASKDSDGYFWFVGRNDDVINTAGHLISPFEIESAILEIPEVAESGVIAAPDDLLFEKVVAYIRLKDGFVWNDDLEMDIRLRLANKLSSIATPQEIIVIEEIPKNKSGKIMRRVLKAWYSGTDPGDISTLDL